MPEHTYRNCEECEETIPLDEAEQRTKDGRTQYQCGECGHWQGGPQPLID